MTYTLHLGDNRELLAKMKPNTVDSIVTDPPYGLEFMGKDWDHGVPGVHFWQEAIRVAKPGAHLLAFGGSRTFHRLAVAIEDAGWEIRDTIMWVYGSGFPKSLDVSKAIDAAAGAEREVKRTTYSANMMMGGIGVKRPWKDVAAQNGYHELPGNIPATPEAAAWQGFGTALKPAHEPIIVARKPLDGTVAGNVLQWGTGAINVDATRIATDDTVGASGRWGFRSDKGWNQNSVESRTQSTYEHNNGRWPANVVHDGSEEVLRLFPVTTSGKASTNGHKRKMSLGYESTVNYADRSENAGQLFGDTGSAARFFYCAKASKADRDEGLEGLPLRGRNEVYGDGLNTATKLDPALHTAEGVANRPQRRNHHPTVKPTSLMRWLVRLVTPPGGTVLDPFTGSGSTGKAAMLEGFDFFGMELDPEYLEIARARIEFAIADQAFGLFAVPSDT